MTLIWNISSASRILLSGLEGDRQLLSPNMLIRHRWGDGRSASPKFVTRMATAFDKDTAKGLLLLRLGQWDMDRSKHKERTMYLTGGIHADEYNRRSRTPWNAFKTLVAT